MKKGFTLVELSIVLVIIGLLIGGILVAQSLIETTKINSQLRQLQQFDIAVSNFKLKFKSIPGDSNKMTPDGNNDKILTSATLGIIQFDGETANFWKHLSETGFQPEQKIYTNTLVDGEITNANIPTSTFFENAGIAAKGDEFTSTYHFIIADYFGATNGGRVDYTAFGLPKGVFNGLQALALDQKFDDGIYNTGVIVSSYENVPFFGDPCDYSTASTDPVCKVYFKMLADQ